MLEEYLIISFGLNITNTVFKYCILGLFSGDEKIIYSCVVGSNCIQCCNLGKLFMGKDGEILEYDG